MALADIIPWFKSYFKKEGTGLNIFTEFRLYSQKFVTILSKLDSKWVIVSNYDNLISNQETGENLPSLIEKSKKKGLMETYNKKWIAFALALDLFKILTTNMQRFISEKDAYLARIKALDLELALKLEPLLLSPQEGLEFLALIKAVIDNSPLVISYIKTHYDELMQKIGKMKYKEIAEDLRRIVIVLSNRETEELVRCITDVKSWPYRGAYGINLYIERTFLLLNGGKSKYDGEAFLGFRLHFRDKELVTALLKAPQFRKLMTYRQELEFFVEARNAIQKSVKTEGKWEGFYAFYNNLDKNIRKVRDVYGNEQFARILEAFKEKKHEAPIDWENELYILYEDLIKRAYQLVVEPAARALMGIFETRIKKLEEEKASALNELRKLLREKDESYKTKREFATILRKKRKKLKKELERERIEFEAMLRDVGIELDKFKSKSLDIQNKTEPKRELSYAYGILDFLATWRKFGVDRSRVLTLGEEAFTNDDSVRELTQLTYEEIMSSNIASKENILKKWVENKYKKNLPELQELINTGENVILPGMNKLISHITLKLPNYTKEVVNILKSRDNIQKEEQKGKVINLEIVRQQKAQAEEINQSMRKAVNR